MDLFVKCHLKLHIDITLHKKFHVAIPTILMLTPKFLSSARFVKHPCRVPAKTNSIPMWSLQLPFPPEQYSRNIFPHFCGICLIPTILSPVQTSNLLVAGRMGRYDTTVFCAPTNWQKLAWSTTHILSINRKSKRRFGDVICFLCCFWFLCNFRVFWSQLNSSQTISAYRVCWCRYVALQSNME